jgi:hypothetical protein
MPTRILSAAAIVFAAAITLAAQTAAPNLTGTWTGGFVIQTESGPDEDEMHLVAKQTGTDFTGTAGPSADRQWPIQKGKVATTKEGTAVSFDVASDGPLIHFELKLVDGHLKGTAKAEQDGRKLSAVVDIQRAK